jgi:cysteine desulfurase/selenocysteine lyase
MLKMKVENRNFDVLSVRSDFPILSRLMRGKPLVYLDNGATTQKPNQVIRSIVSYYENQNANIHRGVHTLSQEITLQYENSRATIQKHLDAQFSHEIIFTSGTTASINLVATSFGKEFVKPGDEIIVSEMEHHSNLLPWQILCQEREAILKVVPVNADGELMIDAFKNMLSERTKLVALTHVSNTLGTINPIKEIVKTVREYSPAIAVMVDGAQSVPHMKVDVRDLDVDFYCFSGHKVYGPTGIGILYGKEEWLNRMPPYQVGGGAIKTVTLEETVYADLPMKFESGTPHIEGGIGLAAAIDYVNEIGIEAISAYEDDLLRYATDKLTSIPGLNIVGTAKEKASVISFIIDGLHPFDVGTILDLQGIAVRTGHHCTQPLMARYDIPGTIRASFAFYNAVVIFWTIPAKTDEYREH